MEWDQKEKNFIRQEVCKGGKEPYNSVLLLPSASCLDVEHMLGTGAINLDTRVVAVERDKFLSSIIAEKLQKRGFSNFQVHNTELAKTELESEQFDFVYLDTCGDLSTSLLKWLAEQVQRGVFKRATKIALAFSHDRFHAQVDKKFKSFSKKNKVAEAKTDPKVVNIATLNGHANIHTTKATILSLLFGDIESSYIYKNGAKGTPMHVFIFHPRKINNGLTTIIRFLATLGVEVEAITPGVKAAISRRKTKGYKATSKRGRKRRDIDKSKVIKALAKMNQRQAAAALNLPLSTLRDFMERNNIKKPDRKQEVRSLTEIRDQVKKLLDELNLMVGGKSEQKAKAKNKI